MIIKYMMHKNGRGSDKNSRIPPIWIEDGGYFYNPATEEYIGWSPDLDSRNYYIPDSVTEYTEAELITYVQGLHAVNPYSNIDGDDLTDDEVATLVTNWHALRGA